MTPGLASKRQLRSSGAPGGTDGRLGLQREEFLILAIEAFFFKSLEWFSEFLYVGLSFSSFLSSKRISMGYT